MGSVVVRAFKMAYFSARNEESLKISRSSNNNNNNYIQSNPYYLIEYISGYLVREVEKKTKRLLKPMKIV